MTFKHLLYTPFTGLGLYGGFRGNRWLRNRIKVFKQFVLPSLKAQTNQNFTVWISWRQEEKNNHIVQEFIQDLEIYYPPWAIGGPRIVNTFHGLCFWDDKFSDKEARDKLMTNLHDTMGELVDVVGDVDYVYMTIQSSDDCYHQSAVMGIQAVFKETDYQAFGFKQGYIMNYLTKEIANYILLQTRHFLPSNLPERNLLTQANTPLIPARINHTNISDNI